MSEGIQTNRKRLLWAGFMAILAAGVGFGIRGGIFANWGADYGFSGAQLGAIGGAGFTGFCFGIIIGGIVVDKIGYGKLVFAAFLFHVLSAFVTFGASNPENAYNFLFWGTFIFAVANGTLEAVSNPLVSTLFPEKRTHYLNILHASWPLGMIFGGMIGWIFGGIGDDAILGWKTQLAFFLVPTVVYGVMFMGQKFPQSEASAKGLSFGAMFKDVGILGGLVVCYLLVLFFSGLLGGIFTPADATPEQMASAATTATILGYVIGGGLLIAIGVITKFSLGSILLFVLFITHALVGAVELGTDGWIQNITGNILTPEEGKILFVWTSLIMFGLRFCADFIERKAGLSPVGLLLVCSIFAVVGLNLASGIETFKGALFALAIYAIGKTFFWPTMLAIVGDRFPRSGAVAMSIMGGIGMLSAGLLGSEGLGYAKDRFSGEALKAASPTAFEAYSSADSSNWLFLDEVNGLDGTKLGEIQAKDPAEHTEDEKAVAAASIVGDRKTLKADSMIPAAMAVIFLLMLLYFKATGGYKTVKIDEGAPAGGGGG